jgi:hypothetical protein
MKKILSMMLAILLFHATVAQNKPEATQKPEIITRQDGCTLEKLGPDEYKLIKVDPGISVITIPSNVSVIGERCFDRCLHLQEITFETGSKLQRIEKEAFREIHLLTNQHQP